MYEIDKDLALSDAFRDLSGSATKLLILALCQARSKRSVNIELPHSFAKKIGVSSSRTITKARKELVRTGFLEVDRKGSLLRGASLFRLSENWRNYRSKLKPTPQPDPGERDRDEPFQLRLVQGGRA